MIDKAIHRAYDTMHKRKWDKIYWAVDLHGTCLESNYKNSDFNFINEECIDTLRYLSSLPESVIIVWSACYDSDFEKVKALFNKHEINIHYFDENLSIQNTATGNFDQKFYFSVLLDDKAGFDPDTDWTKVRTSVTQSRLHYMFLEE